MKPCPDKKETLWLDVYGELDPHRRPIWEKHLENCERCRQERKRLLSLLQTMKDTMPSPTLSHELSRSLAHSITRKLREKQEKTWWRNRLLDIPQRLVPAMAAATILIAALGWFSLKMFRSPSSVSNISNYKVEEQIIAKDLDVIKNLDLLEEMDALQKLVQVVDHEDII